MKKEFHNACKQVLYDCEVMATNSGTYTRVFSLISRSVVLYDDVGYKAAFQHLKRQLDVRGLACFPESAATARYCLAEYCSHHPLPPGHLSPATRSPPPIQPRLGHLGLSLIGKPKKRHPRSATSHTITANVQKWLRGLLPLPGTGKSHRTL